MLWFCTYCRTELRAAAPRIFGLPLQTADLQRVATSCNELQRVATCCNVLQRVASSTRRCQLPAGRAKIDDRRRLDPERPSDGAGGSPTRLATKAQPPKGPIPAYAVRAGVPSWQAGGRAARHAASECAQRLQVRHHRAHMERASAYSPMTRRSCCCRHHLHTPRAQSARSLPRARRSVP